MLIFTDLGYTKTENITFSPRTNFVLHGAINELLEQNKRCSTTTIHKLTTMNEANIESKSEISNMLNNYFVNVGANLSAQAGTGNLKASFINKMPSNMHSCFFQPILPVEVYQVIQNHNSKKNSWSRKYSH